MGINTDDYEVDFTISVTDEGNILLERFISQFSYKTIVKAYRKKKYNATLLYLDYRISTCFYTQGNTAASIGGLDDKIDATYKRSSILYKPDMSGQLKILQDNEVTKHGKHEDSLLFTEQHVTLTTENKDTPIPGLNYLLSKTGAVASSARTYILGSSSHASSSEYSKNVNYAYVYPPYIPLNGDGDSTYGGLKNADGSVSISSKYLIVKAGSTNYIYWTPNNKSHSKYSDISIHTDLTVKGSTIVNASSGASHTAPSTHGTSYTAKVKRYYVSSDIEDINSFTVESSTLKLYTYSKPTLTGISLSKYTLSPRSGESLRVTLNGANNRNLSVENNFRTGIWSNIKGKYYIDETNTNSYRDLSLDNIKTLFPDTSASNGVINGTIYTNRRNLGVSRGNPGNGNLVYETSTHSKNITIHYKPNEQIDPNREPSGDEGSSGIAFYKRENNVRGAKLTPGNTWVLPNNYDINTMTGVDVKIQYPKTDSSGVISGYKIELLLPNDGTHSNDFVWYTAYWYTESYTYTGTIPYSKLKRGISGNRIRITPFYVPSNVAKNDGNAGSFWYGPSTTKSFVDISWMLNDPVIDCPLTNTTWHNHKYRILFKLPKDNDTNYGGKNDIEIHYGSGKYRYQEIQLDINGVITTVANGAFSNARNTWVSVTDVSKANLTYLRPMTINPALIPSYKDESIYRIRFRVRKAYGQNSNFDGWSNWSERVTINRKTVSNTNVSKGDTIMATHYMNVQTAFNNSVSCYKKTASDNKDFVKQESFDRSRGHNINGPHLAPPENTPLQTIKEYVSEFKDLHQLKNKINSYSTYDTDIDRNPVRLDSANNLLATFTPSQEFITAAKDQTGATSNVGNPASLKGRNYMKYMCDELNHLY